MSIESVDSARIVDLPPAGRVEYRPCAAPGCPSREVFERLRDDLDWRQLPVRTFGRAIAQPRLTDFRGEAGIRYRYSGLTLEARPWTAHLLRLREVVEQHTGQRFNSVLCNLYRDGRDYMGWHADDEPELGREPVIASLSFGARRRFTLKPRSGEAERLEFELASGSLLVMSGDVQRFWLHQLPRALRVRDARINLTFRYIAN
ncbi:alpha-ketoglutarate-dependent dioxygenase AlkB family protein [Wenzhouxiangella limi]|uniref:Alpha-ketoglutarate-dependent dioxygenase AlkB n=1 Tax=Wenzhouxiangella limi TaxID=2707351 RepID=A0A845UT13_9GAMM|nr:alpha-ketoglutarate-dependent dioxygenase AlkB [Wenzhouxiangella limi]NDY94687.1 alpha-ketoglutarate-dependent dioxygenase AlkB [Wenzhouxiangella limi]